MFTTGRARDLISEYLSLFIIFISHSTSVSKTHHLMPDALQPRGEKPGLGLAAQLAEAANASSWVLNGTKPQYLPPGGGVGGGGRTRAWVINKEWK